MAGATNEFITSPDSDTEYDIDDSESDGGMMLREQEHEERDMESEADIDDHEAHFTDNEGIPMIGDGKFMKNRPFVPHLKEFTPHQNFISPDLAVTPEDNYFKILRNFLTDDIVKNIITETNRFAQQIQQKNPKALLKWYPVNEKEFWHFMALSLNMGIVHKPAVRDYWSKDALLDTPFFANVMSRNRFQDISRALHFVNNETVAANNTNRFEKLGKFMPEVLRNFKNAIHPGKVLCIDESLLAFSGRLSFKQYNGKKRARFGVKLFVLCDAETNFVVDILPYQGKSTQICNRDWIGQYGFGGATVLTLIEDFLDKGHSLTIDNWFMSPGLAKEMLLRSTYVLGTVQKRRKEMPKMYGKLAKGAIELYSDGNTLLERWMDRREVVKINTYISHAMEAVETRNPNNARAKPVSVIHYNKTMGALDTVDRTIKTYCSVRKSYKWYKKVAFNLFDIAIYNSFIIHHNLHPDERRLPYKYYLMEIVKQILIEYPVSRVKNGRPTCTLPESRLNGLHIPLKNRRNGRSSFSDCHFCTLSGKRKQIFTCKPCGKRLCVGNEESCFYHYHTDRKLPARRRNSTLNLQEERQAGEDLNPQDERENESDDTQNSISLLEGIELEF